MWIEPLELLTHPEGGYYKETYRASESIRQGALPTRYPGDRSFSSAIYYLLSNDDFSAFHRLRSDETWHYYTGCPLHIHVIDPVGSYQRLTLGTQVEVGERLQLTVLADHWFAAEPAHDEAFALAGCTVAPGFDMADFEMASAETLAAAYPEHADLIARLTRPTREPGTAIL